MSKPRILIIEDNQEDADYLKQTLTEFEYEVVGVTNNIHHAYELFIANRPHMCIIDIYLQGKPDGVAFAQRLVHGNENVPIVFLTGNYDNVTFYLAKTTNPHSYLLKPYNPLELQYTIELAMDRMKSAPIQHSNLLFIKRGNQMLKLNLHEIQYIEVDGKYSKIISSSEKFLVQQPLKDLQVQLPSSLFSRIHRNYLVNIGEVIKIDTLTNEVLFKDGTTLSFSGRYLDGLLNYFRVLK